MPSSTSLVPPAVAVGSRCTCPRRKRAVGQQTCRFDQQDVRTCCAVRAWSAVVPARRCSPIEAAGGPGFQHSPKDGDPGHVYVCRRRADLYEAKRRVASLHRLRLADAAIPGPHPLPGLPPLGGCRAAARSSGLTEGTPTTMNPNPSPDDDGPTPGDLAAIEAEWPLIEAEIALVDAEIRVLTADPDASPLDWRRLRRAEARVLREAVLYASGQGTAPAARRVA